MENDLSEGSHDFNKIQEQFNAQRARMKELYMSKEKECAQIKQKLMQFKKELDEKDSLLVIAEYNRNKDIDDRNQEIMTLQQLLQETCDEASVANNEISMLKNEISRLKETIVQQESNKSLESILGLKTLARNVKKITSNSQDNAAEEARKSNSTPTSKYAQEDADTLRSLVEPLEDEICQLKEKLRAAYDEIESVKGKDEKSRSALVGLLSEAQKESEDENSSKCINCDILQQQLTESQHQIEAEKEKKAKVDKVIERLKQDLVKESSLRLDLEKTWQDKREAHKEEVQKLCDQLSSCEKKFQETQVEFSNFKDDVTRELMKVMEERQQINEHLETLQRDNDYLSCRYLEHSSALKDQDINLPQNIEELHELVLRLNENLILSKTGQEYNEKKSISARDEANLLRDQLHGKEKERDFLEQKLNSRIHTLEDNLKQQHHVHMKYLAEKEELQRVENDNKKEISDLRMQNIELSEKIEQLEKEKIEVKQKLSMMQHDLATTETVQKDFVRLSQSLQMQLEKIRSADTQVRWQDEDDCFQCPSCNLDFTVTRRKVHCRHCGTIFCESCCNKNIKSGPSGKLCKVCEICHTLLDRNSAPFFSKIDPKSPL